MRRIESLAVSVLVAMVVAARGSVAGAQQGPPSQMLPPGSYVSTSAEGEAKATPDRATVYVGVQTRGATASAASAENARKQRAVLDTLRALGIASADISTTGFNVFPERGVTPERNGAPPRIVAYTVSNMVRVEVRRLDVLANVLDAVLAKGANEISSLQFYSSNSDDARRTALAAAVARAQADAESMARAAGRCLEELQELSTNEVSRPIVLERAQVMRAAADVSTPINPGEQTVSVTVFGRWRLRAVSMSCPSR